jgi:hypothetical protein
MASGRRFLGNQVRLTRRSWEDVAPELEFLLQRLWESESNGIPAGFNNVTPELIEAGVSGDPGNESSGWAAADHVHPVATASATDLANANAEGVASELARADHKHKRSTRLLSNGGDAGTENAVNFVDNADVTWTLTDQPGFDRVDVEANIAPGAVPAFTQVELDFGPVAVKEKVFTVVDAAAAPTSSISMIHSGRAATGKQADEAEFDAIDCRCEPLAGSFRVYATSLLGKVLGPFQFDYILQ